MLFAVLAAANDVQIQRHAVIDDKASSSLMRQEVHTKKMEHVKDKDEVESDASTRDEDEMAKIEDLMKKTETAKQQADTMLKHSDEDMVNDEDKAIFKEADEDHSGNLDEDEMSKVLSKAGLAEIDFDWRTHDRDRDGKLSENEFLEAGKAAVHNAQPRSLSLLEDYIVHSAGPSKLMKLKDFKSYDSDTSGALDSVEASNIMKGVGLQEDSWRKFDMDGDGKLSEDEFNKDLAALTKDTLSANPGADQDHALFQHADLDSSSFLEESEVNSLLSQIPAFHDHPFEWRKFDRDQDGRLSEPEFLLAGPAVQEVVRGLSPNSNAATPSSLVQDSEEDDKHDDEPDEEDQESDKREEQAKEPVEAVQKDDDDASETPRQHIQDDFKLADKNRDGLLDAQELKPYFKHFNWKRADANHDGKINEEELYKLMKMDDED